MSSAVARAVADARALSANDGHRKDERVRVSIPIESIEHATAQLLRLAPEVEAVEPVVLRRSLMVRLEQACRLYGVDAARRAA